MKLIFGTEPFIKAAAFALRYEVFVLEQKIKPQLEFDFLDDTKREYFVLFDDNLPIATIRYQQDSKTQLRPDRFCVKKTYRKQGYGQKVLIALENMGKMRGCTLAVLSAELAAVPFYQKSGYKITSKPFEEDGLLCVTMQKNLSKKEP